MLSASYDVDIARKYGVAAAALLNKLIYLSRFSPREDGFCWRTAQEIEDELGITKRQQMTAIEKLEEAGLIETKTTYIQGTMTRCKHFLVKVDLGDETPLSESDEMCITESNKMSLSESNEMSLSTLINNQTIIIKHNNNDDFEEVWKEYPRKQGKEKAYKAFLRAIKSGVSKDTIAQGIRAYKAYIASNKIEAKYIKMGSTWFNGQCWDDDYGTRVNHDPELDEIL